jgi:hypothetical protein
LSFSPQERLLLRAQNSGSGEEQRLLVYGTTASQNRKHRYKKIEILFQKFIANELVGVISRYKQNYKKHGSLAVVVEQVFSIKLEEAFKRNDVCRRLQYRYIFYSKLGNCTAFQLDRSLTI